MKTKTIVMVLLIAFIMASCAPMIKIAPTDIATQTNTAIPTSTLTLVPIATFTPEPTAMPPRQTSVPPTPTQFTPLCPIDLSTPGVSFTVGPFGPNHPGIDIIGPHGTPHQSPDSCDVIRVYIDENKSGYGVHLRCNNIGLYRISLHHVDLTWNNYETLEHYGISIDSLFNADGTPKLGVTVETTRNRHKNQGDDLHVYMGNSGSHVMHTHINAWLLDQQQNFINVDPQLYMPCK